MSSTAAKVAAFVISIFMLAYVGYQTYQAIYDPFQTELVQKEQYVERVQLNGFFVREENVLNEPKTGVISYHYRNAQKAAKGAVVASNYDRQEDYLALRKAEQLQTKRDSLAAAQDREKAEGLKLDLLAKQISDSEMEVVRCADSNDFSKLDAVYESLMFNLNKFNSYVDKSISFDGQIAELDAQIAELKAGVPAARATVKTEQSGYFSNVVDGFETVFTTDMLDTLTVSGAEQAMKNQKITLRDNIGKILPENAWYFVSLVSTKESLLFREGSTISLKFSSNSTRQVPALVKRIITEKDNPKAAVLFSGDYLDEDFVTMRFEKPVAVLRSYSGVVIPQEAVRIRKVTGEDGKEVDVKGVYILVGRSVRFRRLGIVYEDSDVVISEITSDPNYVSVYDNVIVKGKDLNETDIAV